MPTIKVTDQDSALLRAIAAQLRVEDAPVAPDPNHNPFGHVRLSPQGGGWICGICGKGVRSAGDDTWIHEGFR